MSDRFTLLLESPLQRLLSSKGSLSTVAPTESCQGFLERAFAGHLGCPLHLPHSPRVRQPCTDGMYRCGHSCAPVRLSFHVASVDDKLFFLFGIFFSKIENLEDILSSCHPRMVLRAVLCPPPACSELVFPSPAFFRCHTVS